MEPVSVNISQNTDNTYTITLNCKLNSLGNHHAQILIPQTKKVLNLNLSDIEEIVKDPVIRGYIHTNSQNDTLEEYAEKKQLDLLIYQDEGYVETGPSYIQLLQEIQPGDIFACVQLSDYSKDPVTGIQILKSLLAKGCIFVCMNPMITILKYNTEQIQIIQSYLQIYAFEEQNNGRKMTLPTEPKARGKPPFGYKCIGKHLDYVHIPEQQAVIKKIIQYYQNGMKINHITKKLNDDKDNLTLDPSGLKLFRFESVRRILCDYNLIEAKGSLAGRKTIEERVTLFCNEKT